MAYLRHRTEKESPPGPISIHSGVLYITVTDATPYNFQKQKHRSIFLIFTVKKEPIFNELRYNSQFTGSLVMSPIPLLVLFLCLIAVEATGTAIDPDHVSIFVNGYGGTLESCSYQAHNLSMYVYIKPPQAPSRIIGVFNDPYWYPGSVSEPAKERVLAYLTDETLFHDSGKIRLVIFCHSNGAKLVQSALETTALRSALLQIYQPENVDEYEENIRNQVAVISFGGVSLVPVRYAKLVLNYQYDEDHMAKASNSIPFLGLHSDGEACYMRPDDPLTELPQSYFGSASVKASVKAAEQISDDISNKQPREKNYHYLDNYYKSKRLMDAIHDELNITNPFR